MVNKTDIKMIEDRITWLNRCLADIKLGTPSYLHKQIMIQYTNEIKAIVERL